MLINKERIAPAVRGARVHQLYYARDKEDTLSMIAIPEHRRSRFNAIIDDRGYECGAVTKRYRLVTHGDLVAAADLASDRLGVDLECGKARYHRGQFKVDLYMPGDFNVPGDPSGLRPQVTLGNSYGGTAALTGRAGVYRLVCTNGMVIGKTIRADYQKHVGNFNVMAFVANLLAAVIARAEEYKQVSVMASQTAADVDAVELIIRETTPRKYHRALHQAVRTNVTDLGPTVWAMLQAISEVSTHDMRGLNATDWQTRHTNRVLELASITV
jgi:hypothetical protein